MIDNMSIRTFLSLIILIFPLITLGDQPSPAYTEALSLYQQAKYDEAKQKFEQALQENGPNAYVLYNLALTEMKLGHAGLAIGLWRKALEVDPGFGPAEDALNYHSEKLKIKELPHKITAMETLRNRVLIHFTLSNFLALSLILFFVTGWFSVIYLGQRHRHKKGEGKLPPFPTLTFVLGLLFVGSIALTVAKVLDQNLSRGTIVTEKVEARTGPGEDQAVLFELFEGMEVIVRESVETEPEKKWVQVTYPGGMTGWIQASALIH
jgi:hypothetical protein